MPHQDLCKELFMFTLWQMILNTVVTALVTYLALWWIASRPRTSTDTEWHADQDRRLAKQVSRRTQYAGRIKNSVLRSLASLPDVNGVQQKDRFKVEQDETKYSYNDNEISIWLTIKDSIGPEWRPGIFQVVVRLHMDRARPIEFRLNGDVQKPSGFCPESYMERQETRYFIDDDDDVKLLCEIVDTHLKAYVMTH